MAMSRAVESWRLSGRPDAFTKWVFCMPSSWARSVISAAKRLSVPASFSAMATAMSLADLVAMPFMAAVTGTRSPGRTRGVASQGVALGDAVAAADAQLGRRLGRGVRRDRHAVIGVQLARGQRLER